MDNNIIVGIGEVLWDVFPDRKVPGGAPANFAYHISQFGYEGHVVSAVGRDELGDDLLAGYRSKGLRCMIEQTVHPTGTVQITLSGDGIPQYEICRDTAWDNIPFTAHTAALARRARAACFGSLAQRSGVSRATIRRFLAAMPADSLRIFDINLRQSFYCESLVRESLDAADMLKINDEEIVVLGTMLGIAGSEERVCRTLIDRFGLRVLVLTKGAVGSYVFTPGETSYLPTPRVEVADTVGAGDSFTAAFTAAYLRGAPVAEAHRLAVEVSAYVCSQYGAMPALDARYRNLFS
ncbi:MAG: carbohydrate kinase [Rikenellaceae bacterium]|nr:carbohydrate kinase [Rikenellaceae bacterium]